MREIEERKDGKSTRVGWILYDWLRGQQKKWNSMYQGIDLEYSPDNDVLASETTLNSNDVRMRIRSNVNETPNAAEKWHIYTFLQYQASIALFPGNETRLLVT